MARKHIFIGCGGAGSKTVALIKMKVYESLQNVTGNRSKVDVMNDNYRFMFIDTDAGDIENLNEKFRTKYENGRVKMLSTNELVNLGTQNPYVIYQKAKEAQDIQINKRIIESCDDEVAMHMDNRALKFGAGAFRLKSRTAFARLADQFCEKLVKNIQDLNKIEDNAAENNTVCYWVVCSSLGGTGSGIINDVLYFVNMMHKATIDEADPKVILTMYMPQWYIDHNGRNEKYPRNAYAVMSELEAEMLWSKKPETATLFHRLALNDRYSRINTSLPYRPFEALIPVDFQTEAGNNLGNLDSMYSNTAELLCYLHDGPGARGFESFMDNTRDGEVAPGTEKNFLMPMGYVALKKPSADFEDYMKSRIQADLLEHCILGKSVNDKANKVDLNKVVEDLIKDTINAYVLNPDGDKNYFSEIRSQMNQAIKTNFSESRAGVIEGDKRVDKFDAGKMNSAVKKTTQSLADVIDDQDNDALQKSTQDALEEKIWACVEELVTTIGLQNTIAAVERLDEECTSLFNHYDKDKDMIQDSIIADYASSLQTKSELNRQNTKYEKSSGKEKSDLDTAREKAEERTLLEVLHVNNNADDIANVYSVYKRGLELKREILIENKIFELIKSFCYGENGFLDVVARHLRALSEAAKTALLSEKGPKQSFKNLAEVFRSKKEDITSVYLPNICEFANGDGWKRDNLFSDYYEKLITPDKEAVSGNVRVPTAEAMTDFFNTMKNQIEADLKSANYIVESLDENGEATLKSKFFINTERSAEKTIDDILNFAYKAFGLMCRRNSAVNGWYDKKLPDLINELTTDQLDEVTKRLSPTLFFSYNIGQMDGILEQRDFCVADNRDNAKKVFNFQESSSQKFIGHSNSELFYIITAKTGMNFEYYRTYHNIKSEYDRCDKKEYYHFHQAFARTEGKVDEIKSLLPLGASNATISMLKLMILGSYDEATMKKFIVIPDKSYLEGIYGATPFEVKSKASAVWATDMSLEVQGDKKIQINIAEKGRRFTPSYSNLFYTSLSNEFAKRYLSDHYDSFIERYMQAVNALDNSILVSGFNAAKQKVETTLDAKYREARTAQSFQEMETLKEMLRVLNDKFKTFEDFTSKD